MEPEQPFSGGRRRMSPGFSPLGRRQKKRLEGALTGDAPPQPSTGRRRQAQRSLVFDAGEPKVTCTAAS